jgi:hypothetical protein
MRSAEHGYSRYSKSSKAIASFLVCSADAATLDLITRFVVDERSNANPKTRKDQDTNRLRWISEHARHRNLTIFFASLCLRAFAFAFAFDCSLAALGLLALVCGIEDFRHILRDWVFLGHFRLLFRSCPAICAQSFAVGFLSSF